MNPYLNLLGGALFLVLVLALIRWKRHALWAKLTSPFKKKEK